MEDESDFGEVVVVGKRPANDSSGGDWAWASFYSTSDSAGFDGFDFGGSGGGAPAPASEEPPLEEPPPEEEGEEVVVTAPAIETARQLYESAEQNVVGDYKITIDGDVVKIEVYDVLSGQHGTYVQSPDGHFSVFEPFDVDSYQPDPSFNPAPTYGPPDTDVWF